MITYPYLGPGAHAVCDDCSVSDSSVRESAGYLRCAPCARIAFADYVAP